MKRARLLAAGLAAIVLGTSFSFTEAAEMKREPVKIVQTAGRAALGEIAPEFAHLNDDILFGEVWSRNDKLSLRDRSLVTVATLVAKGMGGDSAFVYHMTEAKKNGIGREEMAEILTHEAFYAGWPNAWQAFNTMKKVYTEEDEAADEGAMSEAEFDAVNVFGKGVPNTAYAKYFVGNAYLNPLTRAGDPLGIANVTFEPGCRNNWHVHHAKTGGGQVLIVTAGRGWYQAEGEAPVELVPGTIVEIPANVKHWHGAARDSWMSHLAFEIPGTETGNEWLEPVSEAEYMALP